MLPNVLIIGAAKCGTTSLHYYLGLHPAIFMSHPKELNFWSEPDCLERRAEYERHFPTDHPVRGESSVRYSYHPLYAGTPARLYEAIPGAKLIYLIRDPIERAIAHYAGRCAERTESRSLEEAFASLDEHENVYVASSLYATQIEQYLNYFPRSNLLVLDQGDLLMRRQETLRSVFSFLGVDETFTSRRFAQTRNTTAGKRRPSALYERLERSAAAGAWRRLHTPRKLRDRVIRSARWLAAERVEAPVVSESLRRELTSRFEDEPRRLRSLVGESLLEPASVDRC